MVDVCWFNKLGSCLVDLGLLANRSGGLVTSLLGFIIFDFILVSSCLLVSLLGSVLLAKIILLGFSSFNCFLQEGTY